MKKKLIASAVTLALVGLCMFDADAANKQKKNKKVKSAPPPTSAEEMKKIQAALPAKATVKPAKPRKILIFSLCEGFVHKSIPVCTDALMAMGKKTGAFSAETTESKAAFTPENLARFDAVVFNNTTRIKFNDAQKKALLDFVRGGKGVIGIHAATDNFYDWPEGAAMLGGCFSGHPWTAKGTWAFKLDEPDHPLNRAFGGKGFKLRDEIYQFKEPYSRDKLRVLVSLDLSDPDTRTAKGGHPSMIQRTDGDFAVVWIRREGKGRVFYSAFGHNREIFWNKMLLQHYLDGIQYALGDLKVDDSIITSPPKNAETPKQLHLEAIKKFTETTDQAERYAIEKQIFQCPKEKIPTLGKALATILQNPETTQEGKIFACRMLRYISPDVAIPALAALLPDPKLSHMARFALQGIDDPSADQALIEALNKVKPPLKPGIIDSLAQRHCAAAVKAIAPLMNDNDANTVLAAINALGRIGTKEASTALAAAKVSLAFSTDLKRARLNCATMLIKTDPQAAATVFQQLYSERNPDPIRAAALIGLARTDPAKTTPEVLALLDSKNKRLKQTARGLLKELPVGALIGGMGKLSPENQVRVIQVLADRGETAAEKAMLNLTKSFDETVKTAAFAALGRLGGAASVKPLLDATMAGNTVAFKSLCELNNANDVDDAILNQLETVDDATKIRLIQALAIRKTARALPKFFKIAEGTWSHSCKAAIDAIGTLATEKDFPAIADLMLKTDNTDKLSAIEAAILTASQRITDHKTCTAPLADAYAKASGEIKYAIIRALGSLGCRQSLTILRSALNDSDEKLKDAAIRGLANWPNKEVAELLLDLAKNANTETHRVLALRGYIRLADNLTMYKKAAAVAEHPAELKSIISGAAKFETVAAHDFISGFLDNKAVKAEARQALKKIENSKNYKRSKGKREKQKTRKEKRNGTKKRNKQTAKKRQPTSVIFNPPRDAIILDAEDAAINGSGARYESNSNRLCVGGWREVNTWVSWTVDLKPGTYRVSTATSMGGNFVSEYEVEIAGQKLPGKIVKTAGWHDFPLTVLGEIKIAKAGPCQVAFRPLKKSGKFVGNLRAVILEYKK